MARKHNNPFDKARQAIAKGIRKSAKTAKRAITHKQKQAQRLQQKELLARWRALNKLGLIKTKNNPAIKNITPKIRQRINKEFHSLQGAGHYIDGRVQRPLNRQIKASKSGQPLISYDLNDNFKFLRTKKKTKARSGIIKTSKGYIIAKQSKDSKISITDKGEIKEKIGKITIKKSGYTKGQILKLRDDIISGKIRIRKNEYLTYRPWGSQRVEQMYAFDSLDEFADLVNQYEQQMTAKVFDDWLDRSEVVFLLDNN